jgi:hypothetical protein
MGPIVQSIQIANRCSNLDRPYGRPANPIYASLGGTMRAALKSIGWEFQIGERAFRIEIRGQRKDEF